MNRIYWMLQLGVGVGLLLLCSVTASAVVVAFDNANPTDLAYADGWDAGDNGGFGFGPWGGSVGNAFTREIDTDSPEPDNNIGTPAFRLGAEYYTAERPFSAPMSAGQSFSMDFDQFAYDVITNPPEFAYVEQDSLVVFKSFGPEPLTVPSYERLSLYNWFGKYTQDGVTTTYNADEWGIGAGSAFDNLNGGAALPVSGGLFKPGYTGPDSQDGFSITLDIVTIDTYRLRIVDDGVTKVDVSGALLSMSDPDGGNGPLPPGDVTGQALQSLLMWFTPGDFTNGQPAAYFTNLQIATTEAPSVPGDYNNNGVVDGADYVVYRDHSGTAFQLPNEVSGTSPGQVTPEDYAAWRARFGNTSGSGSLSGGAVPEPASFMLLVLGYIFAAPRCRAR